MKRLLALLTMCAFVACTATPRAPQCDERQAYVNGFHDGKVALRADLAHAVAITDPRRRIAEAHAYCKSFGASYADAVGTWGDPQDDDLQFACEKEDGLWYWFDAKVLK